jgi:hypothetical protein
MRGGSGFLMSLRPRSRRFAAEMDRGTNDGTSSSARRLSRNQLLERVRCATFTIGAAGNFANLDRRPPAQRRSLQTARLSAEAGAQTSANGRPDSPKRRASSSAPPVRSLRLLNRARGG